MVTLPFGDIEIAWPRKVKPHVTLYKPASVFIEVPMNTTSLARILPPSASRTTNKLSRKICLGIGAIQLICLTKRKQYPPHRQSDCDRYKRRLAPLARPSNRQFINCVGVAAAGALPTQ